MRGRKRLRKKLTKANAALAWEKEMMRFTRKLIRPATYFTFAVTPAGFHLIDAVFDDIEEERTNDSSAAT